MNERAYKALMRSAVLLTLAWVGWTFYDTQTRSITPESLALAAAVKYLEDGNFGDALTAYTSVLEINPENLGALRGKAQALMQLGAREAQASQRLLEQGDQTEADKRAAESDVHYRQALDSYDEAIRREDARADTEDHRSIQGVAYANRGILKDRMGDYPGALSDYRMAIRLEPKLTEGPGLLTRFMRNQPEKPPTVLDRARYLEEQLKKSEAERLLELSDEDVKQRPYRLD
jgi:tetratricopeptide (TPR) repeat protein